MSEVQLHRGAWVVPIDRAPIADGVVAFRGATLQWVGAWSKRPRALRDLPAGAIHEHGHAALLSGFVNPHSHVALQGHRGIRDGAGLVDWLQGGVVRVDWSDAARNQAACEAGFREGLAAGITTWGDNHFLLAPFRAAQTVGVRATCFLEIFGVLGNLDHERASLHRRLDEARAESTAMVQAGISPHAIYTVPPELLNFCATLAASEGWPLSIHLAESADERTFLNAPRGALRKFIGKKGSQLIPPTAASFTQYLKQHRLLTERTLIIHGVHLNRAELKDLARAQATLVHCPVSNCRLRCGIAPIAAALQQGVPLALGTDSVASGERHDLFYAMNLALLLQEAAAPDSTAVTAAAILRAATLGGAEALGRASEVGSLTAGKAADLVVYALPEQPAHPARSVEEELVYGGERSRVRQVWLAGRKVVG